MSERGHEPPDPQKLEQSAANAKAIESQEIPPTDWPEVPTLLSDLYRVCATADTRTGVMTGVS